MTLGCMNDAAYRPLVSMCYLASFGISTRLRKVHAIALVVLSVLKLEIDWMPRTYARLEVSVVRWGTESVKRYREI